MAQLIDTGFSKAASASRLSAAPERSDTGGIPCHSHHGSAPFVAAALHKINFTGDAGRATWPMQLVVRRARRQQFDQREVGGEERGRQATPRGGQRFSG